MSTKVLQFIHFFCKIKQPRYHKAPGLEPEQQQVAQVQALVQVQRPIHLAVQMQERLLRMQAIRPRIMGRRRLLTSTSSRHLWLSTTITTRQAATIRPIIQPRITLRHPASTARQRVLSVHRACPHRLRFSLRWPSSSPSAVPAGSSSDASQWIMMTKMMKMKTRMRKSDPTVLVTE